jgi:TPR repeat protein
MKSPEIIRHLLKTYPGNPNFEEAARLYLGEGAPKDHKRALRLFMALGLSGHGPSRYAASLMMAEGEGIHKNPTKAIFWLMAAVDAGVIGSRFDLGMCYCLGQEGLGMLKDAYAAKMPLYDAPHGRTELARAYREGGRLANLMRQQIVDSGGDLDGTHSIVIDDVPVAFVAGLDAPQDMAKAARLFRLDAEAGLTGAQIILARMYEAGRGVEKDETEAVKWYLLASLTGNVEARFKLGVRYRMGDGVPRDPEKSLFYLEPLAEMGEPLAQMHLGCLYASDYFSKRSMETAIHWFNQAEVHGCRVSAYNLALIYFSGMGGIERDLDKAAKYGLKAAKQGFDEAQYLVGLMYENGEGLPENPAEAFHWYELSASQNNPKAQFATGFILYHGIERKEDRERAFKLLTESANQGNEDAIMMLNECFPEMLKSETSSLQ